MKNIKFSAATTVLNYLNSQAINLFEQMPNAGPLNRSTLLSDGPFDIRNAYNNNNINKTTAATLLTSPTANAHSNFMYANWIGLHAKTPDQTNYLFCLQGNIILFVFFHILV